MDELKINFERVFHDFYERIPLDNYLKTFNIQNFTDPKFISILKEIVKGKQTGGESSFGKVYTIPYLPEYTIKLTPSCQDDGTPDPNDTTKYDSCVAALDGNKIYKVPNTVMNKTMILGPNNILENVIGMLLHQQLESYTSSFIRVYGFQYDNSSPQKFSYTIMESLDDITDDILLYPKYLLYIIFEVIHAIDVAQKTHRFVHNDLHRKNVMLRYYSTPVINVFPIKDGRYVYTKFTYDAVIMDYGFSRLEINDEILTPRIKLARKDDRPNGLIDYGFNPYYDVFSILKSLDAKLTQTMESAKSEEYSRQTNEGLYPIQESESQDEQSINDKRQTPPRESRSRSPQRESKSYSGTWNPPANYDSFANEWNISKEDLENIHFDFSDDESSDSDDRSRKRSRSFSKSNESPTKKTRTLSKSPKRFEESSEINEDKEQEINFRSSRQIIFNLVDRLLKTKDDDEISLLLARILINRQHWRPDPHNIMTEIKTNNFQNVATPEEMLLHITNLLEKSNQQNPPDNFSDLNNILDNEYFYVSDKLIEFNDTASEDYAVRFFEKPPENDISLYKYKVNNASNYTFKDSIIEINDVNKPFDFTDTNDEDKNSDFIDRKRKYYHRVVEENQIGYRGDVQYLRDLSYSIGTIKVRDGMRDGYSFNFDCCNIDPHSIFQNTDVKSGIAVNAISLNSSFIPSLYFKKNQYNNDLDVQCCKKYTGFLLIRPDGMLDIVKYNKKENYKQYENCINSGPVLVWGSKIVFKEKYFEKTTKDGNYIFQARNPEEGEEKEKFFADKLANYKLIAPGELSHASTPMKRTAILILENGDVKLIYVNSGGYDAGVDLYQLAQICKHEGAVKAINLDGGREACMVWRDAGDSNITEMSYMTFQNYPVGTTISFVKK